MPTFKPSKGFKLPKTDMSKLRSKQRRASKGISEFQHFSKKGTQGDEPIVEKSMKESAVKNYKKGYYGV